MRQINVSVNEEIYKQLKNDAEKSSRSLSNKVGFIINQYYRIKALAEKE